MRRRPVWLALGGVLLLAAGVAVVVPIVRGATGEPAPSTSTLLMFACAQDGDRYCERIADDLARRAPISDVDRKAADRFRERLGEAFTESLGAECEKVPGLCAFPEPPTAEAVRAALSGAGWDGPVVRPARFTDPAPRDAIVYAVRAGYACLLGWIDERDASPPQTVGRHPDGSCLPP